MRSDPRPDISGPTGTTDESLLEATVMVAERAMSETAMFDFMNGPELRITAQYDDLMQFGGMA